MFGLGARCVNDVIFGGSDVMFSHETWYICSFKKVLELPFLQHFHSNPPKLMHYDEMLVFFLFLWFIVVLFIFQSLWCFPIVAHLNWTLESILHQHTNPNKCCCKQKYLQWNCPWNTKKSRPICHWNVYLKFSLDLLGGV